MNRRATAALRGLPPALLAALMAVLLMLAAASGAAAVPDGFEDTFVAKVSGGPSEIAWTPDGRMLVGTKNGQVRVYSGGTLLPEPALDLAAVSCTNAERGLQGVAVHPGFAANRFVYVYYNFAKFGPCVPEGDAVNRLSRFVLADDNTIDPASELVLFESQRLTDGDHNGGNVAFGRDGLLYVTTGDGGDTPPLARDPGALVGKVLRLTDAGDIPAGNPFTGAGTARCSLGGLPPAGSPAGTRCQEVFAMGLRNPFRVAFDPNDPGVRFHVNDVGNSTWEEVDLGQAGADYGWPTREGPCPKDADLGPDCDPAPAGVTNPIFWYHHSPDGGAATGGAFVPNGAWPSEYDGAYLFAEFVAGTIMRLVPQAGGGFAAVDFTPAESVTTLRFGPDGALYYASRGSGGEVRRIAATGGANRSPTAVATAAPMSGPLPLTVQFDGSASSDPDGNPLTYAWDFGDGSDPESGPTASHTYAAAGTFLARLTVSDGAGGSGTATVRLDPGNTAPEPAIDAPLEGERFAVGDAFTLRGRATDAEDGALPASSLTWEVIRHHATHVHPFLEPIAGNEIPIVGPDPEDLDAARTSYLEIRLTATDSRGLATTVSRDLRPKLVPLTFATTPAGLTLSAGGVILTGPTTLPSWERFAFPVEARGQTSGGVPLVFGTWSDGGAAAHTIVTPAVPTTYTAAFGPVIPTAPPRVVEPVGNPVLTLGGLRASPARFFTRRRVVCVRSGVPPARRCRRVPAVVGTNLRFTLSAPARVAIAVVRPAARICAGRGPARRCRIARARTIGRIAVNGRAGANSVRLGGRLAGRPLAPGPYELRARAARGAVQSNQARLRVVVLPA